MNKLKAGISFIAFLPSVLYVFIFGYFALCSLVVFRVIYKCQKQINRWKMIQEMLLWYEKTHWYVVFLHKNLYDGKEEAASSGLPCLVHKYFGMEGYYVEDCSL